MFTSFFQKRFASSTSYYGTKQISLPRRPLKKIKLGKARAAIYHQFEVQVELTDGSVITRKSQYPKAEFRLIQDQRNNILWNKSRSDLTPLDINSKGSLYKFKQKYGAWLNPKQKKSTQTSDNNQTKEATSENSVTLDHDYLNLINTTSLQVQTGGKLATKKRSKR